MSLVRAVRLSGGWGGAGAACDEVMGPLACMEGTERGVARPSNCTGWGRCHAYWSTRASEVSSCGLLLTWDVGMDIQMGVMRDEIRECGQVSQAARQEEAALDHSLS